MKSQNLAKIEELKAILDLIKPIYLLESTPSDIHPSTDACIYKVLPLFYRFVVNPVVGRLTELPNAENNDRFVCLVPFNYLFRNEI